MAQQSEESLDFLMKARQAVEDLSVLKDREVQLKSDEKRLEKTLEAEQKGVADSITMTIRQRMEEINNSYDQAISKGQDKLKKSRVKREKAKNQGVKERIAEETSELLSHNRELRLQMKTNFQKNRVPFFCNSNLYYSLYFPRWFGEIAVLFLTILICFLAVPYGIYYLLPVQKVWYLAGIYFADVVLFGGVYIAVSNKTKMFHMESLKAGRSIRDQIHSNNKKIKVITSTIKKDKNESAYNLEKYDDEISVFQQELTETANKKKEALNTFENVTKSIITDEILNNNKPRIDKLEQSYSQILKDIKEAERQVKEKSFTITDKYEIYLGKEFLDPLKIAELSEIIKSGRAVNITEAIAVSRTAKD